MKFINDVNQYDKLFLKLQSFPPLSSQCLPSYYFSQWCVGGRSHLSVPCCAGIFRFQVLRQCVECQRIIMGGRCMPCMPNDWPNLLARVLKFLKLLAILRSHRWNNFICNACSKFATLFITEWGDVLCDPTSFSHC